MSEKLDGTIPPAISEKLLEESAPAYLKVSGFLDWLNRVLDPSTYWVVLAEKAERNDENSTVDFFTWSVLVRRRKRGDTDPLLSTHDWLVHLELGKPTFARSKNGAAVYVRNDHEERGDFSFEPVTILRTWPGHWKPSFEVIQEYVLYHEAHEESGTWSRIGPSGEKIPVLRKTGEWPNVAWEAPREELRDFLAAKGMLLLRQHDHTAWLAEEPKDFPSGTWEAPIRKTNYHFRLYGAPSARELGENPRFGKVGLRLYGKDVVKPAKTVGSRHTDWMSDRSAQQYEKFVVGTDDSGTIKRSTCNPAELSNYFGARPGAAHALTGVYFDRRVLRKYYAEPDRFQVDEPGSLRCLDLWVIPLDCLPDCTLHVYLSDLSHLPYEEQRHWGEFDVLHKQEINRDRFTRDFDAKFTPPPRDVQHLIRSAHGHLTGSVGSVNPPILRSLRQEDSYLPLQVFEPFEDSWTDFDQQILVLAKLVPDSLSVSVLKTWSKGLPPLRPIQHHLIGWRLHSDPEERQSQRPKTSFVL